MHVTKARRIGEILREARIEAGLSARDLERLTDLSTGEISQIETGKRRDPAFSVVLRAARGIGISMEELALRFEGRTANRIPDGASAKSKVLAAIQKAQVEHARLGRVLNAAQDALKGDQKVPPRKR